MSAGYRAISWTPHKKVYDLLLGVSVIAYLVIFVVLGLTFRPQATLESQLIRALGTCAFLLLHVILSIGPLARLDSRFLPLLYNRRHLGVTMFLVALGHGLFSIVQFHALGNVNPLVSVLTSNGDYSRFAQFPFQPLGLTALAILFLMAATSHDFWLANLTAPVWKSLHMMVYLAYALIVLHVALGVLQSESNPLLAAFLGVGVLWIAGLHAVAGQRERAGDEASLGEASPGTAAQDGFVTVCGVQEIADNRAKIFTLAGERVAVFRYQGRVSAVSNVCQHQDGPLGEGKIIDGCITCPWHGYQYRPHDGASPPPFTEKIPTFRVRVKDGQVSVHPTPLPPGTAVEPALIDHQPVGAPPMSATEESKVAPTDELYVGYLPDTPPGIRGFMRRSVFGLALMTIFFAVALPLLQARFDRGIFELGQQTELRGRIRANPYPIIEVERAGTTTESSSYLLVDKGKAGAAPKVHPHDGESVALRGTLIYRPEMTMVELAGELEPMASAEVAAASETTQLGEVTLSGEIVDTKCFLGVMKPGRGKPHRSCAARCIAGGVPPALLVEDRAGNRRVLLLVSRDREPLNEQVLDWVGQPVTITGNLTRRGDLYSLEIDPEELGAR